jgi:DNA replication protein DnaC
VGTSIPMQAVPNCPDCGGTGWSRVVKDGAEGVARCDCHKLGRTERLLEIARIPPRYADCELANFLDVPAEKIELAKIAATKFAEDYPMPHPTGLLFMGPPGVGKTHLAVGIMKQLIRQKSIPCLFCTFPELLKHIQNSYNPVSQTSELALLAPVLEIEVLVLDELGAQNPSPWVRDMVAYVLNHRYNENKVTIITTNYFDPEEGKEPRPGITDSLVDRIGNRMRSRLFEMCKTIKMDGNDYRRSIGTRKPIGRV